MNRCVVSIPGAILFAAVQAFAATLRVPGEFATIQLALNASAPGDTVLVAPGHYHESLTAPAHRIYLNADAHPDSVEVLRPVVNPSTLPGADSLACLTILGDSTIIENFIFRNGPEMYPHRPGFTGGVHIAASHTSILHCDFDSTYHGVKSNDHDFAVIGSRFMRCQQSCIQARGQVVTASECLFTGDSDWALLEAGSHSILESCTFRDIGRGGHYAILSGTSVTVRQCVFGPGQGLLNTGLMCLLTSSTFDGNLFTENVNFPALLALQCQCDSPIVIRNNRFMFNHSNGSRAIWTISLGDLDDVADCRCAVIEFNVFSENNDGAEGKAIRAAAGGRTYGNRFLNITPDSNATVFVDAELGAEGLEFSDNIFLHTGYAVQRGDGFSWVSVDARHNYWGHASGPFHPVSNPGGLGDRVSDDVLFDPWHSDTLFLEVPEQSPERAASYALRAFPNPFNQSVTLRFEIPEPGIFRIQLFDVLGRRVEELWSGPVAYEKEIVYNASHLASGVYFARAWQPIERRPVATTKVVLMR